MVTADVQIATPYTVYYDHKKFICYTCVLLNDVNVGLAMLGRKARMFVVLQNGV